MRRPVQQRGRCSWCRRSDIAGLPTSQPDPRRPPQAPWATRPTGSVGRKIAQATVAQVTHSYICGLTRHQAPLCGSKLSGAARLAADNRVPAARRRACFADAGALRGAMYNRHYLPLRQVLSEWASQSGQSSDMILLTLAEHVSQKALPLYTFKRQGGTFPNDIAIANLIHGLASSTEQDRSECRLAVEDWDISFSDLRQYCGVLQIRPPVCMTGKDGRLNWLHCTTMAPPQREATPEEVSALTTMRHEAMAQAFAASKPRRTPPKSLSHAPGSAPHWTDRATRSRSIDFDNREALSNDRPRQMTTGSSEKSNGRGVPNPDRDLAPEKKENNLAEAAPPRIPLAAGVDEVYQEFVRTWDKPRSPTDSEVEAFLDAALPNNSVTRQRRRDLKKKFGRKAWHRVGRPKAAVNSAENSAEN